MQPQTATGATKFCCGQVKLAVLIPCYNEEAAIAQVVSDFRAALTGATIYVYDNNSRDRTIDCARAAGAEIRSERLQGKGNVVRRMFADVDAEVYILVDGDGTYDAASAVRMVELLLLDRLDLINGRRMTEGEGAYRSGHRLGNAVLSWLVRASFGAGLSDMLSGYKVLSRRFAKTVPLLSSGFEIETELAVHALSLRLPIAEVPTLYRGRSGGSASKLRTYRDGFRILKTIVQLIKEERPLWFFSCVSALLAGIAIALAIPVLITFFQTGLVPRLPTAVLSASIMVLSFLSLTCGLILDTVTRGRREMKRLAYLAAGPPIEIERGHRSQRGSI
jgi:glycosyltransferase involved in cell wall biosynthesis